VTRLDVKMGKGGGGLPSLRSSLGLWWSDSRTYVQENGKREGWGDKRRPLLTPGARGNGRDEGGVPSRAAGS